MKATITFPTGEVVKYDDQSGGWIAPSIKFQLMMKEIAKSVGSDVRQQIDELIKTKKVKVTNATPPEPPPAGAVS